MTDVRLGDLLTNEYSEKLADFKAQFIIAREKFDCALNIEAGISVLDDGKANFHDL